MGGENSKIGIKSDNSEILLALKTIQQESKEMRQELNATINQLQIKVDKLQLDLQKN